MYNYATRSLKVNSQKDQDTWKIITSVRAGLIQVQTGKNLEIFTQVV